MACSNIHEDLAVNFITQYFMNDFKDLFAFLTC